ncbi:MAG TPA: WhiB family transcriptional regulator [Acidimicrobiia bacterium]|jgi:WhiB family redox-sensing transcriptional regulator
MATSITTTITKNFLTGSTSTPQHWRQYARCLGSDPEIFHPHADDPAERAKAICAICPVREPCLEYAITAREKQGVWGGLTEKERRRLIRQRRRSA